MMKTVFKFFSELAFMFFLFFPNLSFSAESTNLRLIEAINLFEQQKFSESKKILLDLTALDFNNSIFWFNLGNAQFELEEYNEALLSYQKVNQLQSPLSPAATLYQAKCYLKLKKLTLAKQQLLRLQEQELTPSLKEQVQLELNAVVSAESGLDEAFSLYQDKNYAGAEAKTKFILKKKSIAEGYNLLGLINLKTGQLPEARKNFEKTIKLSTDENVKITAQKLIEEIDQGIWNGTLPYWLFLDIGYGTNSNVFQANADTTAGSKSSPNTEISAGAGYRFFSYNSFAVSAKYSLLWDEYANYSTEKFISHSVNIPFSYSGPHFSFLLEPGFKYLTLANLPFLSKSVLKTKLTYRQKPFEGGIGFEKNYIKSENLNFDYLAGDSSTIKVFLNQSIGNHIFGISYLTIASNTSDLQLTAGVLPIAYFGQGLGLNWDWFPATDWSFKNTVSMLQKIYFNNSTPNNLERKDNQLSISSKLGYFVNRQLQIYVSAYSLSNTSTFGATAISNKNYSQMVLLLGFSWDILP